jgi:hypothetical protein
VDRPIAGRHLLRHQAEPGGKVWALCKGSGVADGRCHGAGDERAEIFSRKTISPVLEADQKQGVLARIDANGVWDCSGCLIKNSEVLLVLLSPRSFSERFGTGARPIHPISDVTLVDDRQKSDSNGLVGGPPPCGFLFGERVLR